MLKLLNVLMLTFMPISSSLNASTIDGVVDASQLVKSGQTIYDPGLRFTAPFAPTKISKVDGLNSQLYYLGKPFEDYLGQSYVEVASQLTGQKFPDTCMPLPQDIAQAVNVLSANADPMWGMRFVMSALAANHSQATPENIFGYMPTIMALLIRKSQSRSYIPPRHDLSYTDNFFYMATGLMPNHTSDIREFQKKLLNKILIGHADHDMNLSTSVTRMTASGYEPDQKDYWACVGSGLNALAGPRHGAANTSVIRMFEEIGSVDKVAAYLEKVQSKEKILWGFGHRIYKKEDPRAKLFASLLDELYDSFPLKDEKMASLIAVARELRSQADVHPYILEKGINPNMDYYSGLLVMAMGALSAQDNSNFEIPETFLTAVFAWGRLAGWLAHINEERGAICRPKAIHSKL